MTLPAWNRPFSDEELIEFGETNPPLDLHSPELDGGPPTPHFRAHWDDEVEGQEPPEDLIAGLLSIGALGVVFGPPESFKTFFTVALGFSVVTKTPFYGRAVRGGFVVYVAGEGGARLGARITAWKAANLFEGRAGVLVIEEPVRLLDRSEVARFLADLARYPEPPVLIIFDTLALCMPGSDEGTADMSAAVEALRHIRQQTGATVAAVHHTPVADPTRERGAGNLRGGVETVIALKRDGSMVTVSCEKQRDAAHFEPFTLEAISAVDSLVLVTPQTPNRVSTLFPADPRFKLLQMLHDCSANGEGLSTSKWLKASKLPESSFYALRKKLIALGYVACAGTRKPNIVTPLGEAALL